MWIPKSDHPVPWKDGRRLWRVASASWGGAVRVAGNSVDGGATAFVGLEGRAGDGSREGLVRAAPQDLQRGPGNCISPHLGHVMPKLTAKAPLCRGSRGNQVG